MAGAGVARDLALRGASVALFEKGDFASGTSSKSSKLIHGGLRYLELFDFAPGARVAAREEDARAPRPAPGPPAALPGARSTAAPRAASSRCGSACGSTTCSRRARSRERYRVLRPVEALSPGADDPRRRTCAGAGYYFDDLLLFPERLCLENVLSAARHGARVHQLLRGRGVRARPTAGRRRAGARSAVAARCPAVKARVIVNCAGPWVDRLRELAGLADGAPRIVRHHQGHPLPAPAHDRPRGLPLDPRRPDDLRHPVARVLAGRHHRHRLRRRSRPPVGDPGRGDLPAGDGGQVLPDQARRRSTTWPTPTRACGRCPSRPGASRVAGSRASTRWSPEGPGGRFLSVTGTKLTCFRSLAEDVGDRVMRAARPRRAPSRTARLTLDGTDEEVGKIEARAWMDVSEEMAVHRARRARALRDARRDLRPGLPARARAGAEAARRHRAPLPEQSRDRGPAPPRGPRGAGGVAAGRAAAPHGHRPEPLPRPRLRGVDRARAWPSSLGWSHAAPRRRARGLSQHVDRSRGSATVALVGGWPEVRGKVCRASAG